MKSTLSDCRTYRKVTGGYWVKPKFGRWTKVKSKYTYNFAARAGAKCEFWGCTNGGR